MRTKAPSIACAVALLALAASPLGQQTLSSSVVAAPKLTDLRSPDELKAMFNTDIGRVRLVLLVSPT